jgi:hypothetical protein
MHAIRKYERAAIPGCVPEHAFAFLACDDLSLLNIPIVLDLEEFNFLAQLSFAKR